MKSVNLLGIAGLVLGFATMAFAQAPAVELKVGDKAPNFKLQASDGKTYNLADFAGKKAVVVAWFPAAFTKGCTVECKIAGDERRQDPPVRRGLLHGERRSDREEHRVREGAGSRLPAAERSDQGSRHRLRRAEPEGIAKRWTFYIGKDGTILAIDKPIQVEHVGRRHGRQARRAERRQVEIATRRSWD